MVDTDGQWAGPEETIVAIASAPGRGGIGVVRISGPDAFAIARTVFRGKSGEVPAALRGRRRAMLYGEVYDRADGRRLDEALALLMSGPHSYTGEDVVELQCHGSPAVLAAVCRLCEESGARTAGPGEFTLRAFRNGRLDLTQAEAVRHLVDAETAPAAKFASAQGQGALGRHLGELVKRLLEVVAPIEAAIDFPGDEIEWPPRSETLARLEDVRCEVAALVAAAPAGRALAEGAVVTIAGLPNAGKSTLFNSLLGHERAIVTPEAGTTRDVIEARWAVHGVPVLLRDTAGLRSAAGPAEEIGVRLARQAIAESDLILLAVDLGQSWRDGDDAGTVAGAATAAATDLIRQGKRTVVVLNKADLVADEAHDAAAAVRRALPATDVVEVSAMLGTGLDVLLRTIGAHLGGDVALQAAARVLSTGRQEMAMRRAGDHLANACAAVRNGVPEDLLLIDVYQALDALAETRGQNASEVREAVVQEVFARFCVGK